MKGASSPRTTVTSPSSAVEEHDDAVFTFQNARHSTAGLFLADCLILIHFQDEPKSGSVSAWQEHAGLIHSLLSGRNRPPSSPPLSNPCDNVRRCCCWHCSEPRSNKPPLFWALAVRPCRASRPPSASTSRHCPTLPATGADAGNPCSPKRKKSRS